MPDTSFLVVAAWIVAAYLIDNWDRFPHLAITSPEKRCGKTLLLDLLYLLAPRPRYTTNISPAALYRLVEKEKPTLLMDESQSLSRRGSEASEVIREILNAGIGRNSKVTRCAGENHDVEEFSVYSPKVFALIGEPDAVLADRTLPVPLRRKTANNVVERYRSRVVEAEATKLQAAICQWAEKNAQRSAAIYDTLEPFPIENDRMADLLLPLQAVLTAIDGGQSLGVLHQFAQELDARDREQEMQSPGVRLLAACREIFGNATSFISTESLIKQLASRREEPWYRWNKGFKISRESLANLLRPYGIRPSKNKKQTARGYHAADFQDAWKRYLTQNISSIPSIPSNSLNTTKS
jgi:hypothetical protein